MIIAEFELVFVNVDGVRLQTRITKAWESIPAATLEDLGNEIIDNFPGMTTGQLRNHPAHTIFHNNSGRTAAQQFSFAYANVFFSTDVPNSLLITIHID